MSWFWIVSGHFSQHLMPSHWPSATLPSIQATTQFWQVVLSCVQAWDSLTANSAMGFSVSQVEHIYKRGNTREFVLLCRRLTDISITYLNVAGVCSHYAGIITVHLKVCA
jgi:hypothetical protein